MPEARAPECAVRALDHYDFDAVDLDLLHVSENETWAATDATGAKVIVRVHRVGYSTDEELASELEWIDALRESGIGVAASMRARDGSGHVVIAGDDGIERRVGVIEWIDGPSLASSLPEGDPGVVFRDVGAVMAGLHSHSVAWAPPAGFTRRSWDLDGFFGAEPHWGRFWEAEIATTEQRGVLTRLRDLVRDDLEAFGTAHDRYGLIHADLHPANLIVGHDGLVVIDFDDAGFGWHMYDAAVALYSVRDAFIDGARAQLVEGYRSVRDLPDAHEAMIDSFLVLRGLVLVSWAEARPELDVDAQELLDVVLERGEALLSRR